MKNRLYDATKIDWDNLMFSTKELWMLLIPIMVEQMLNSLMGMADTMMVSNVGSVAMSAVSLVDSINTLVIQVFAALATGAAIICSHYLGKGDERGANKAARQIFLTVIVISLTITAGGLIFCRPLLRLIFGAVEPAVMEDSIIYFLITASSYPFIALFNAGGAFYRAGGNSKFPMKISIISNVLNIIGNAVLIFGCNMGVAGAAISTLVSRAFCAIVVLYFLRKPKQKIVLNQYHTIRPDFPLIGKVLAIGIPAGVENGMFQFGKLAIQSTVSTLGTQAIAAQAMTVIFENVNGIAAIAVGIGLMTVVGQAFGAGRKEEAKYYIIKLTGYAEIVLIISCAVTFLVSRPVMRLAGMEAGEHGTLLSDADRDHHCKTGSVGIVVHSAIWTQGSGGCKILYDHSHMYDVVLQSDTCDLSDPFSGIWTDRSVDRYVCRLGNPKHYLLHSFYVRQMDGKTCDLNNTKVFRKINVFLKTFFVIM